MQDNGGELSEVHSASSVLNLSRYNGCDRYIAKTFQAYEGTCCKTGSQAEWYRVVFTPLRLQGRFFIATDSAAARADPAAATAAAAVQADSAAATAAAAVRAGSAAATDSVVVPVAEVY